MTIFAITITPDYYSWWYHLENQVGEVDEIADVGRDGGREGGGGDVEKVETLEGEDVGVEAGLKNPVRDSLAAQDELTALLLSEDS